MHGAVWSTSFAVAILIVCHMKNRSYFTCVGDSDASVYATWSRGLGVWNFRAQGFGVVG